ncbi:MAG: T9SS type A sorting domain-containing protein [Saprospiraceae bacterium]
MKRILTFTIFTCFCLSLATGQSLSRKENKIFNKAHGSSRSVLTINYILTTFTEPYTDLTGATSLNNGEVWDEPSYGFALPFPFQMNGNNVTSLQFFGSGSELYSPTNDPDIGTYLLPFETDLIDRGAISGVSMSPISYKVSGVTGSRILKVEFKNAGSYYELEDLGTLDMYINFQLWIYEGNNRIEFHFGGSSITDPVEFYGGDPGAISGIADYNSADDVIINPHFIKGPAAKPTLSTDPLTLTGTPPNGIVYRLSLPEPLVVSVSGEDATSYCSPNGTATADVSGGTVPYTYHWNNGATTSTITNLNGGMYAVTVTDANAMTGTGSTTITIPNPIEVNASSTNETAVNANDGTAIAIPTDGLPPFGWDWSNGSAGFQIVGLAPGIYTVTITDDAGCTASQSVVVNAFGCPPLEIISSVLDVSCNGLCDGAIQIVNVDQGVGPFTYMWSGGITSSFINNLCVGDYEVIVTDINGCIVNATYHITQPPLLTVTTGSTTETGPGAGDGTAWAIPSGGTSPYSYAWSNGGIDSLITGLVPGTYSVTVTDGNMCSATNVVVVNMFTCTTVEGVIINNSCFESCDGSISVTLNNAVLPVTFLWEDGSTQSSLTELCAGTYGVTATDATGCSASGNFLVTQPGEIFPNASSTDETAQSANDGTAWATPFGGLPPYSYLWNNGSIDSLITDLAPDLYSVVVTDALGCSETEFVDVNVFSCFEFIDTEFKPITCFGDCDSHLTVIPIGGTGPYTYAWSTGDTTEMITNLCGDSTYTVIVTDIGRGCFETAPFWIFSPEPLTITIESVVDITPTTKSSVSVTINGGTQPYLYAWSGPNGFAATTEDLFDIPVGYYNILVTDAHGCTTSIDSIEIKESVGISNPDQLDVRVYPNPAREKVYVEMDKISNFQIQLYSSDGRIVKTWRDVSTLDVSDIAPGIYAIKVTSGEKYYIQRLVIEK